MLARQEKPEEPYQEVPTEQAEREGKRSDRREFVHHVLNTSLRSHFQVLFFVTALLAMLVTIGSGISASRGYTLVETQSEATRIEQENERLNVEIAMMLVMYWGIVRFLGRGLRSLRCCAPWWRSVCRLL